MPKKARIVILVAVAGVIIAAAGFGVAAALRNRAAKREMSDFERQVDLSPFDGVAVLVDGRLKSFASHAYSIIRLINGGRGGLGARPGFAYFDLMFHPEGYRDAEIIYVKNKPLRAEMRDVILDKGLLDESAARKFMDTGLVSPRLLSSPSIQRKLEQLDQDVLHYEKHVARLRNALVATEPRLLAHFLHIVPPRDIDPHAQWASFDEITGKNSAAGEGGEKMRADLAEQFVRLGDAWEARNAGSVNAELKAISELLPRLNPDLYPSRSRLVWESRYFKLKNMTWIWIVYMMAVLFLVMAVVYGWRSARFIGLGFFILAFGLHSFHLGLRWYVSGRWPNANMFEAVTTAAWFGGVCALVLEILIRRGRLRGLFALGSAVASMTAMMAAYFLPLYLNPEVTNVMPVLNDVWLYIHTNVIIFSYCLIFMASVTAVIYLLYRLAGGEAGYARAGGGMEALISFSRKAKDADGAEAEAADKHGSAERKASAAEILDGATMIMMELSVVMLWAGIIMGAIWAEHSWGRPWGWDPKETFALNTLIVFLVLIHVRGRVRDKGLWTAVLTSAGCLVMLFNWIVINFVITGLHSYV